MLWRRKRKGKESESIPGLEERKYRAVFDSLPDCVFLYDQSGKIVDATRSALDLFGYDRSELRKVELADLYPGDAGAIVKQELKRVFSSSVARFELECRKKSGALFPAEISASLCVVSGQQLIQILVRDVAQTKLIVRCLRENDEITRAILECALDSIISVDDCGRVLEFNPAAEKMFGYTRQEALGASVEDLIVPRSLRESYHQAFRRCVNGQGADLLCKRIESVVMRRNGSEFPVELRVGEVRRGASLTFTAYLSDISTRKEAVTRLAEEKDKLEAILSATSDGMVLLDRHGCVVYANRSFEDMAGVGAAAIEGLSASDLCTRLQRLDPDPPEAFEFVLGPGHAPTDDGPIFQRCRISGVVQQRTLRLSWLPLGAQTDGQFGRLAVFRDVTWEDEVHRAKDDLIGNVSHELRTPLASIQGFVQLLTEGRAGPISDKQRRLFGIIEENVDRLKQLVSDLLDVDRVTTAQLNVDRVDLIDLLCEVISHERSRAERKKIAVQLVSTGQCWIVGDRERLYQVFQNLIANAIKYTREGGVTVSAAAGTSEDAIVEIADTGIGISEAELPRIFERFFRSSAEYAKEVGGTGLGLSIVKALVERHGGSIEVQSDPSAGTKFRIMLPVEAREPEPAAPLENGRFDLHNGSV